MVTPEASARVRAIMSAHGPAVALAPTASATLDDVELGVSTRSGGGGGGGGNTDDVVEYMSAAAAGAALDGRSRPKRQEEEFNTSCDELEQSDSGDEGSDTRSETDSDCEDLFDEGDRHRRRRPRRRAPRDRMYCFGCMWGTRPELGGADQHIKGSAINQMLSIFDTYYGNIEDKHLAKCIHLFFKENIYKPAQLRGNPVRMWRTEEIYKHFTLHTLEPRVWLGRQLRKYMELSAQLEKVQFVRQRGATRPEESAAPDDKNIKAMMLADKRVLELYAMPLQKMNFFDPTRKIDFAAQKKLFNPLRDFAQ